jgi:guanylate kinase
MTTLASQSGADAGAEPMDRLMSPFPIILSAPSGGGKTTISKKLLASRPDVGYSVSATTRDQRHGEADGRDYHFLTHGEFVAARERGEFAEWAEVHGKLYGTLRREVERVLEGGRHVIMDIDVQGALTFKKLYPQSVLIFLLPPSAEVLLTRLQERKTEDPANLLVRLETARRELESMESYEYVVVNGALGRAVQEVSAIIDAEQVRRVRGGERLAERAVEIVEGLEREIAALRVRV